MRKLHGLLALALAGLSGTALAQTTLPLSTGYDHGTFSLYGVPSGSATVSDNYWIKIASYEPPATSVPVAPAFVIAPDGGWAPAMNIAPFGSRWIGPMPTKSSAAGVNSNTQGYSIFRKCFCLMPGYQNPQMSFSVRGDNKIQVWFNSISNTLATASNNFGFGSSPAQSAPVNAGMFKTGLNCVFVLLEDGGGAVGFNLSGTVSAMGLMPVAGSGTGNPPSFGPCSCNFRTGGLPNVAAAGADVSAAVARRAGDEFGDVVQAIVRLAEARRSERVMERPQR
jgi:hypothetical protein